MACCVPESHTQLKRTEARRLHTRARNEIEMRPLANNNNNNAAADAPSSAHVQENNNDSNQQQHEEDDNEAEEEEEEQETALRNEQNAHVPAAAGEV